MENLFQNWKSRQNKTKETMDKFLFIEKVNKSINACGFEACFCGVGCYVLQLK